MNTIIERLQPPTPEEQKQLLDLWEQAVRQTHLFLREQDIQKLRPVVAAALQQIPLLYAAKDETGQCIAFLGVEGKKIEMLFVSPAYHRHGIGKQLLTLAIETLGANSLDVNEQNPQALGFYQHMGFAVCGRSDRDGQDNPFPILHLKLR